MSKIYEALLRAEEERNAGIQPATLPTDPPAALPVSAAAATAAATSAAAANPAPAPTAHTAAAAVQAPRPYTQGRTLEWKPQLTRLPALEERGSAVEQFRSLRSRLSAYRDLNPLKSLLISSGLPREGKSFVAVNLAIALARHKSSRVLLIDGDMRRSTLHEILGCPSTPGLSTYLAGKADLPQIMQHMAVTPNTPALAALESLSFIAAGEEGDKAADLSGSSRFRDLIQTLGAQFDWIIVDSSPVNLVADGANLGHACDGVLLVARGAVTRFEDIQHALGELKASKVVGVVLNAVEKPPVIADYYGYDRIQPNTPGSPDA